MAKPKQFTFDFKEIAALLVKQAGVSEGLWGIFVRFGLQATNIGPSDSELKPAAVIPIIELGIQQFDKPNSLTVDAAEIGVKAQKASKKK